MSQVSKPDQHVNTTPDSQLDKLRVELMALTQTEDISYWAGRAARYASASQYDAQLLIYRRIETVDDSHPELIYNHALTLDRFGLIEEAEEKYRRAIILDPSDPDIQNNLALLLYRCGRVEESRQMYEAAIEIHPDDCVLHTGYGDLLWSRGRLDSAAEHYKTARTLDPSSPKIHARLAEIADAAGDPIASAEHTKAILNSDRKVRHMLYNRVLLLVGFALTGSALLLWIIKPSVLFACILFLPILALCTFFFLGLIVAFRRFSKTRK